MSPILLLATSAVLLTAPSAIQPSSTSSSCPLPCPVECAAAPVVAADASCELACCDLPCAAGAKTAVAAR